MEIFNNLKRYYKVGALLIAVVVIIGTVLLKNLPEKRKEENLSTTIMESSPPTNSKVVNVLEITGQVNHPGVYEVKEDLMVIELINLAGGFTSYANLEAVHKNISLSKVVEPQEKIYIPGIFENSTKNTSTTTSGQKVSINNATLEQLVSLPDIGESTANRIISARPFTKLEDLKDVEGIGDKTYNNIVSNVTL